MATHRRDLIWRPSSYIEDSSASHRSTALSEMEMSLLKAPPQDQQKNKIKRKKYYSGTYNSILIAVITTVVPLLALSGVLLYLVFHYRVEQSLSISSNLKLSSDIEDPDAYYIDFSATKLTTIASWMSSIATLLPGSIMTIFSYSLAKTIKHQSEKGDFDGLPTPYQLAILIETLDGKLTSLWNGLTYCAWKRRANINILLRLAFTFLVLALILK